MYAAVEFVGACEDNDTSNEIAVIPTRWLYKHDKRCYWPNRLGKFSSFDDMVKSNPESKSTWPTYKVYRVHIKTDNFDEAEEYVVDFLRDKNHESNYETDGTSKSWSRKKVPVDAGSTETPTEIADLHSNLSTPSRATLSFTQSHQSPSASSPVPTNFEQAVLQQTFLIKSALDQQSIILQELLRNSRSSLADQVPTVPSGFPDLPFKTIECFREFEKFLSEDETMVKYLKARLAAVGGSGVEHIVRRMMKMIFSNELGCKFNWKGRGEKHSFEDTNIVKVLKEAAKQNFPPSEKSDLVIENTIKDWLKFAPTRRALENKKAKK